MRRVIVVEGLRKHYGQLRAGEGVSFDVDQVGVLAVMFLAFTALASRVFRWE